MEAAAQSRRLRLEELKRRKEAESSTRNGVGAAASGTRQAASDGVEESASMIRFDDADMKAIASGADVEEGDSLEDVFRAWSTAKLVRSFRVLDRRLRIDYDKLKDTVEKGECLHAGRATWDGSRVRSMLITPVPLSTADVAGIEENVIQQDEARRQEELVRIAVDMPGLLGDVKVTIS